MKKEKILVIFSGGLDSTTLVYYLHNKDYDVHTLSFDYGQKHIKELNKALITVNKLNLKHQEVNMSFMKELLGKSSALLSEEVAVPTLNEVLGQAQPITYVPFRNQLMLSVALSYAEAIGANKVCFGAQAHDEYSGYWDTTMNFVNALNNVAKLNRENQIKIIAPFVNLSKSEEIVLGKELKIPYSDTLTCYKGTHCGDCPTCKDRIKAFAVAGIPDQVSYKIFIDWNNLIQKYKKEFTPEDIMGIKKRVEENL